VRKRRVGVLFFYREVFMKLSQETITSRKNPLVMLAASLNEKKFREEHGLFLAMGHKLCREAVAASAPVTHVLLSEKYAGEHLGEVCALFDNTRYRETVLTVLSEGCFDKISPEKAPEGIILIIKHLDISKKYNKIYVDNFKAIGRAILLSSIRDPGNLGTIMRSAGAFGASAVILTEDCADVYHPRAVRAAMGAVFRVPTLRVADVHSAVAALQSLGRRVLAAELREHAVAIGGVGLRADDVFIIGNEGQGIPLTLSSTCDASVYLPIAEQAESLNAAAAAAVILWEQAKIAK
jgi:TrmH family RNA methyltransferase